MKTRLLFVLTASFLAFSCCNKSKQDKVSMVSVEENGETTFYSEDQKAYDQIYLGMIQNYVDSLLPDSIQIESRGISFKTKPTYVGGRFFQLHLQGDTVSRYQERAREIANIINAQYGSYKNYKISEVERLALPQKTVFQGNEIHWGKHWENGNKFIVIGNQKHDYDKYSVWLWIFNTDVWDNLGGHQESKDSSKF